MNFSRQLLLALVFLAFNTNSVFSQVIYQTDDIRCCPIRPVDWGDLPDLCPPPPNSILEDLEFEEEEDPIIEIFNGCEGSEWVGD